LLFCSCLWWDYESNVHFKLHTRNKSLICNHLNCDCGSINLKDHTPVSLNMVNVGFLAQFLHFISLFEDRDDFELKIGSNVIYIYKWLAVPSTVWKPNWRVWLIYCVNNYWEMIGRRVLDWKVLVLERLDCFLYAYNISNTNVFKYLVWTVSLEDLDYNRRWCKRFSILSKCCKYLIM